MELRYLNLRSHYLLIVITCLLLISILARRASSTSNNINPPASNLAAASNAKLKRELTWSFGGKTQKGWHLYAALIGYIIGSDSDVDSTEFVEALARWQKTVGLPSTGILDGTTWMKMVSVFQSRRIEERAIASAEKLFQAPVYDFYDSARAEELRYVDRQAYAAYKQMKAAAMADLSTELADTNFLKIISAFRSPEYQARLRAQAPNSGRAALALNSPHFTGRALDLYVGGEPVSTRDENRALQVNTPIYQWLVKNAERFGFYPYFYEPWHWEYRPSLH